MSIDVKKTKRRSARTWPGVIALRRLPERQRVDPKKPRDFLDQRRGWVTAFYRARQSPRFYPEFARQLRLRIDPMLEHQDFELPLVKHFGGWI